MEHVVKILFSEDGEKQKFAKWHYIHGIDAQRTLCTGEVFGFGEGNSVFETKFGKITCPDCISIIKKFKKVKL